MKRDLNKLSQTEYDLVIIGSGIYGSAIAWDATLRGLSVALIDKGDFGSATSANSLKIVHGGLRYLQELDFRRMRESVRERRILMRIAPHLVHPLPCVMPTYGHLMKGKEVMRVGMLMNDLISFDRNRLDDPEKTIPGGRVLSKGECLQLAPGVDGKRVTGGVFWHDAQTYNSERLALSFVLSASKAGAQVANYVEATEFLRRRGRIDGVKARDVITGNELDIRARVVVNASGGWVDKVLGLTDGNVLEKRLNLSTAMNLVVSREVLPGCAVGITSRFRYERVGGKVYRGRRVLFVTPWRHYTLVGTYHRPYSGDPDALRVTEEEIQTFLDEVNGAYPGAPICREEVSFFHKGFLPMEGVDGKTGEVKLTKHYRICDHSRDDGIDGLISVVGVKYTTARNVAEKTVDIAFKKLGKKSPKCTSHVTPLAGGDIGRFEDFLSGATAKIPKGLNSEVIRHLVHNYGSEYQCILEYGKKHSEYGKTVPGSSEVLMAEVFHAVREEMAQKLADVILRRTDLGSGGHPGDAALKGCAGVMAKELGWSKNRMKKELEEVNRVYIPEV